MPVGRNVAATRLGEGRESLLGIYLFERRKRRALFVFERLDMGRCTPTRTGSFLQIGNHKANY